MQYKAILWDLDGTLLDTLKDLADSVNTTLSRYGMPTHSEEAVCSFVGNGMRRLIERSVPAGTDADTVDAVLADFNAYYAVHCTDHTAPYEGILPLLSQLKQKGIPCAVVSNKADYAVKPLVAENFKDLISVAQGALDGVPRKPDPAMTARVLEQLGVAAEDAVYIGDSEVDVTTAANVGTHSILVTWGFRTAEQLKAAGAVTIVETMEELSQLLLQ